MPNFVNGAPWTQQYSFNESTATDITGWINTGNNIPSTRMYAGVAVTRNRVYLLGGYDNVTQIDTILTAQINSDGQIMAWSTDPLVLPIPLMYMSIVLTKTKLYILGGDTTGLVRTNRVFYSPIDINGRLGSWVEIGTLPETRKGAAVAVLGNRVYLIGGGNDDFGSTSSITTTIDNNDNLGSWSSGPVVSSALGYDRMMPIITNGFVFVGGGWDRSGNTNSYVLYAPINGDNTLGSFSVSANLLYQHSVNGCVFVNRNRVFIQVGYQFSQMDTVQTATINGDGSISAWSACTVTPAAVYGCAMFLTNGYIYLVGGRISSPSLLTYRAPFSNGFRNYIEMDNNEVLPKTVCLGKA